MYSAQVSKFEILAEFVLVQIVGDILPLYSGHLSRLRNSASRRSSDSLEIAHKRLEIIAIAREIHFHRMEIPQQQHQGTDQNPIAGRQKGLQHRFVNARVGGVLCQFDSRCAPLSEQRKSTDNGGCPSQGQHPVGLACGVAVRFVRFTVVGNIGVVWMLTCSSSACRTILLHYFLVLVINEKKHTHTHENTCTIKQIE